MDETGYNGYTNRATWAMSLNLDNDYGTYMMCQAYARHAARGNETDEAAFHAELAVLLEQYGRMAADMKLLPDFDPDTHESPDPKDPHGPDDVDEVDWLDIAKTYDLTEYIDH